MKDVEKLQNYMQRIKQELLAELQERRGADFPQSAGGHWLVNYEVSRRFLALLANHGVSPTSTTNPVYMGRIERLGKISEPLSPPVCIP